MASWLPWLVLRAVAGTVAARLVAALESFGWVDVQGVLSVWVGAPIMGVALGGMSERLLARGAVLPIRRVPWVATAIGFAAACAWSHLVVAWGVVGVQRGAP